MILHPIPPVYDANSKILILGSFPSVKSRENGFFYGNPKNRFWSVLSQIYNRDLPHTIEDKKELLLSENIALWDVIKSCEISGSSDSSITNVVVNDLSGILHFSHIEYIFTNGKKADALYKKHLESDVGIKAVCLPSTSPANASWNEERLISEWSVVKEIVDSNNVL